MSDKIEDGFNFGLKPSEIYEAMEGAYLCNDSLMIWGPPGIGKSELAKFFANEKFPLLKDNLEKLKVLKAKAESNDPLYTMRDYEQFKNSLLDQDSNFVDFRLSQVAPEDLRGMPLPVKVYLDMKGHAILESDLSKYEQYQTETVMVWVPPEEFKLPPDWKGVIMFDEINSAIPIVQAASYQLVLDRCIGQLKLPQTAFIVAAGNRETDGGVTFTLATPLRDRMTHVEMIADHTEWIENYAIPKKLNPATVAYVRETGGKNFNTLKPNSKSLAGGSSPRSYTKVSAIQDLFDEGKLSDKVYKALVAGRLGNEIAIDYVNYIKNMEGLPSVESILNGETTLLSEEQKELSKSYFIALNVTYRLIDLFFKKESGDIEHAYWCNTCENYMKFIDTNFSTDQPELVVYVLRVISKQDVIIRYTEAPYFKVLVERYGSLIRRSRNLA